MTSHPMVRVLFAYQKIGGENKAGEKRRRWDESFTVIKCFVTMVS